jgi:hypothetical protein
MNKWLMLVVLVLLVLASAVGLRNLAANQTVSPSFASTGAPVPILPDGKLFASTGAPVPILPDGKLFASTGAPVPILPDGKLFASTGAPVPILPDGR